MDKIVPLSRLGKEGYGQVICYPRYDSEELNKRLEEMRQIGVKALCFRGEKRINGIPVLGKGCVGIVVLGHAETGQVALKIRRTDADRKGMQREADMLRIANSVNVGPKMLGFNKDFLVMEFVDGTLLPRWLEALGEKEDARMKVREVLREVLEQCWRLDEAGLDHGELSRAPKHIIVDAEDKACILDFETASIARKISNVTSICHYLFMRGKTAELVSERTGERNGENLLAALKMYKANCTRETFEGILRACML